jgi:hypothetical protein
VNGFLSRLFGRSRGGSDPERLLDELRPAAPARPYGALERARDFRAAFLGSEAGRRVLWQILEWCRMYRTVAAKGDPYETYRRDGERAVGLRILAVLSREPPADGPGPEG